MQEWVKTSKNLYHENKTVFFCPDLYILGPMEGVGRDEAQPQGGALAETQSNADVGDGAPSDEFEAPMDTSRVQHERELEERMLGDDVSDEEPERPPDPVDDTRQSQYVDGLTLPRQLPSPNSGAGLTGASTAPEEPGNCRIVCCPSAVHTLRCVVLRGGHGLFI